MSDGWIKLYRRLLDWEWYTDSNTKALYIHLLLKSNHRPRNFRGSVIERGQLAITIKQLEGELGMSRQQIRTAMRHLTSTGEISVQSNRHWSIITLNHYADYQADQPMIESGVDIYDKGAELAMYPEAPADRPASLDEVANFVRRNNLQMDPAEFYNYYNQSNWTDSRGQPVRDWRRLAEKYRNS